MKAACVFYNKKKYLGPSLFLVLQVGLHVWAYNDFLMNCHIFGPLMFVTSGLYFIVRFKDPGTIPIVKVELPLENNQIEVKIENNEKREVLNAQANDESNGQISLDQFKDGPDNDNTIQKYYPEQQQQQSTNNQHIISGRGMLSSPSSEQEKINIPNKQTCISTSNAAISPILTTERRFCMQCLNEQPMRAKHCQYCKKCVPLFDHHCPWIGICIGEKNKLLFLIYLLVQIAQLIVGIRISVQNIGLLVVMGVIVLLLISLLGFHAYYVAKNITTWEYLSWKRISYINQNSRYPFDKGYFSKSHAKKRFTIGKYNLNEYFYLKQIQIYLYQDFYHIFSNHLLKMQSLFVKCQKCQQRPATIKCNQCRYGQTYRLCYSCDSQIHNRTGPVDQQHKTEIIPYQEMYQKNQSNVPVPQKNDQRNSFKKNDYKPQPQVPTKDFLNNEYKKPDYSKTIDINRVSNKHDYLDKKIDSHEKRADQQYLSNDKRPYSSNQKITSDNDRNSQQLINQLKEEQQQTEKLKAELSQANQREREAQRRLQKLEQEFEQKIREDKQKVQQLTEENRNLNNKLNQTNKHIQEEVNKVRNQYEEQINELEQILNEKNQQLESIAQEYNLEELQQTLNELQQESQMKDQIIEQLQQNLHDNQEEIHQMREEFMNNSKKNLQSSNKKSVKSNDNQKDEYIQELAQQLEAKDEEIHKLEDLIENFKQLYQHMSDEKQQLQEEVEKLANENNQFRDIFSQNLHLFGIDPEQLNEEGEEGDNDYPEEIAEENDDQND
ncbi:unnamed protein product (macronuclear) [Paramecium tetraurelia]|uniref:Palmitoyltransferase n=1 Tax=Paramecium tetraurelia TaxID=5888 RepID=A0DSJ1_PARTE|nr:uncharacterized protein GSPATT00019712001 [Paramecium tetraurelia]CAK86008.1 unnamed protein product [Paramecium tetraurelia]|eukprot:XP_001453405.1 hypothetical protein (macronuclear) [Paramecium tetraurelia strain d4-2]